MKAFVLPTIFTAVDQFTSPVNKMNKTMKSFSDSAFNVAKNTAIAGTAILAPLGLMANAAIKFEDKMADVAKTTGIAGGDLRGLGDDILDLATKTRTPIEGLQQIAEIGGQLGITGRKGVLDFTDSVNKFNVALGSDFQGGVEEAARAIGGLNVLFKETRGLEIADSITRAGSAINALSAKGVQVPELTEFTKRIGQLPDAIKPTIQETIALGSVFNKAGISAEVAARGLGDVLITASQNAPGFAKQIGLSVKATQDLLNTNPTEFLKKFATSMQGIDASEFAKISKDLKLADTGSIKVIGSLASGIGRLSEFQAIANDEFIKGVSIGNEYDIKMDTTAAKLLLAKNNFEALSITIGTELIPMIGDLLAMVTPVIKRSIDWVRNNKELVKTIAKVAVGISAFLFVVSAVSAVIGTITALFVAWNAVLLVFNAIMLANPIVWVVLSYVVFIGALVLIIAYWKEWGSLVMALMSFFMPAIALVVSLVMAFYNNWQMIVDAFSNGGILDGLLAIGKVLLDVILSPLQSILEVISAVTGADWAASAANGLKEFRTSLDLNTGDVEAVNPKKEQQEALSNSMQETVSRQQLDVNVNDPNGRATTKMSGGPIPIKLSSTHNFGG